MTVEIRDDNTKLFLTYLNVLGQGKQGGGIRGKRQDIGHM